MLRPARAGLLTGSILALALVLACDRPSGSVDAGSPEASAPRDLILATTTSTQDSGLLDVLVPRFEAESGIRVKTIAVGTGKALAMGRRGDADVLLTHAPALELEIVSEGHAANRRLVMHNDFLIVGPADDPAGLAGGRDGSEALARLAAAGARFASRGDESGTHYREKKLWQEAGVAPAGDWYLETGQGMGATLLVASEKGAYALTDRGTWLALKDKLALVPQVTGDPTFLNVYSVMEVSAERHPRANAEGARAFAEFLLSEAAQGTIRSFGVDRFGEPLFVPDAGKLEASLGGRTGDG